MKRYSYIVEDSILQKSFAVPTLEVAAKVANASRMGVLLALRENRLLRKRWKIQRVETERYCEAIAKELSHEEL